ncbi:MAG: ABC transporter ATP-binding protein [Desulfovibrionaceae bacterium]|jgi:branched-chain amino acid transport system ATP-binding protein|nr:ABC transporter ATP-binding protein [Desulfovibrionaceae bacterium]
MISLKNVDVFYGKIHALRRASLHVRRGEIVALIGANGAGKTTLLSTISGLLRPAPGGRIDLAPATGGACPGLRGAGSAAKSGGDGGAKPAFAAERIDLTRRSPDRIVRLGVSHVPEGRQVWGPMSVADNILLGSYCRTGRAARAQAAEDMAELYRMFPVLEERSDQMAGTLSGGEQQMLAIARALMARPRLLLLDEPGMGLAPTVTREIFRHIVDLRDRFELTVLLVEQNARSALQIADRGYVLETGRIVLQGPAEELLANRDVQRAYLGRDLDS